tara:strand:+ start:497 stop:952 length:456 start_codon:yes stop_codon:yes gene_type:complete
LISNNFEYFDKNAKSYDIKLFMKIDDNLKLPSNKTFGLFFSAIFFLIYLWLFFKYQNNQIWVFILGFIFLVLGLLNSKILKYPNLLWIKFGYFLGIIISPIIMGVIFFLVITPINVIMKIFQKDVIGLKKKGRNTYWLNRNDDRKSMRNQF